MTASGGREVNRLRSMLKSLTGKGIRMVDDAGVETVLTLAFVAQVAMYSLPFDVFVDARRHFLGDERAVPATGTVVQMPEIPSDGRTSRATSGRTSKGGARPAVSATSKAPRSASRVSRPDPVDDPGADDDQLRASENAVRITIIGPDGQARTKVVRLSGSRDGMTAPTRRPHD